MANYRPKLKSISALASGTLVNSDVTTSTWGMALLQGTALSPAGQALGSGALLIWEGSKTTGDAPDHTTFTDDKGVYGVTVKANTALKAKFYQV